MAKNKFWQSKYFHLGAVILTISGGALFLFWQVLSGKFLFPQINIGLYHYMYFMAMKYFVYGLHMLPNWWPGYNSGYPINLTLNGFLNPVFILALKFFSPLFANNLMVFLFFIINGLSFYAFARAIKLSRIGGLIAALSYAFSGVVMKYGPTTGIVALMPFLPLSFLCCLKIMQGKLKWFWLWLGLLIYSWIGGWSEMIVYASVATGLFAVYLIFSAKGGSAFGGKKIRPALFFGAIILSIVVLLPWFLSILYFVSQSSRSGGVSVETAGYMPTTISHLLHMIYPRLSVFYGETLPLIPLSINDYFLYVGTLPLLLILFSFFIRNKKEKNYFLFFLFLAAGGVLMTINHSPLFWLFHQIPLLKLFGGYWKWSFIIVFSFALLAGYGLDNIKDFFKNRFSKKIVIFLWGLMILALIASGLVASFDQKIKTAIAGYGASHYKNTPDRAFNRTDNYYQSVIEKMSQSIVDAFSLKNKWVLLTFILWLLALIHITLGKYELISHQKWRISAVLITFLGSVLVWTGFFNGPPASFLKTEPETAKYLHAANLYQSNKLPLVSETSFLEPYRIYLYTPDQFNAVLAEKYGADIMANQEIRDLFSREMMDGNINIAFNFDIFSGHETLGLKRLWDVYYLSKRQKEFTRESYSDTTPFGNYVKAFSDKKNWRLLGALNIKYILTLLEFESGLKPIFKTYVAGDKLPVYIYENPHFMPRWYFAEKILWTEPNDEKALADFQTINDFKKTTLLEKNNLNDAAISAKADPTDKLELQLYTAGKLIIKTRTKNYRFLVFSENRRPFWQVMVNNSPAPLYTANYLFQAVLVPPGENIVEFRYPDLWQQSLISAESYADKFFNKYKL